MGRLDYLLLAHDCPLCKKQIDFYETDNLVHRGVKFKIGEPLNLGDSKKDFEIDVYSSCLDCKICIHGVLVVRNFLICHVKEIEYYRFNNPRELYREV